MSPTADQVAAQLRIIIPALGTIVTAYGVTTAEANTWTQTALALVGPASYLLVAAWTFMANTREAILRKAAKSIAPDVPAPQIVLPKQEAALADKLPDNVTSAK